MGWNELGSDLQPCSARRLERDDVRLIQSVIASAAKQSTQRQMDCFAALAMTIHAKVIML
jgi:hypothetical protein